MSNIAKLKEVVPLLKPRDQEFALNLISHHSRKGSLSEKQLPWVDTLIARAATMAAIRQEVEPSATREQVGDFAPMLALFDRAKQHLKYPAIVLHIEHIGEVKINVAGDRAKQPGTINVAENKKYGEGKWFGRILTDGTFAASSKVTAPTTLLPELRAFAKNPAERAAEHGRLTGKCCFCNRALSDPLSTSVGYGKVCADHYGMPYSAKHSASLPSLYSYHQVA